MSADLPIYYWDSSVFIAWLKNEQRPGNEMAGVYEIAEEIAQHRAILLASDQLTTELVPCKLPDGSIEIVDAFFKRRNAQKKRICSRVVALSREIRNWKPKITTPDAIHLATAILYQADEFHTFDEGKKGGGSLLALSGNVAGHSLTIKKPPANQFLLKYDSTS